MRSRKGLTLIELLVVLSILLTLCAVGGGIMSPQVSMFTERAAVEEVVSAFRRAQALARSRGLAYDSNLLIAPGTPGTYFGVAIFDGTLQRDLTLAPLAIGQTLLIYSQGDPLEPSVPVPTGGLITLNAQQRSFCTPLRPGLVITRQWGQNPPAAPTPICGPGAMVKFQFYSTGELDVYQNGANRNSSLGALVQEPTVPTGPPVNPGLVGSGLASWTFDVVSDAAGWMRVRIRPGGAIENSVLAPLDQPPTTRSGRPF